MYQEFRYICVQHVVICSDTLFYEDFRLEDMLDRFNAFKQSIRESNMLVYVNCADEGT